MKWKIALLLCQALGDRSGFMPSQVCVPTQGNLVRSFIAIKLLLKGGVADEDQGVCRPAFL